MTFKLFNFKNQADSSRYTAFETSGSISLVKNTKGERFAKEQYSTSYNKINTQLFGDDFTVIGAEKSEGKNYLVFTNSESEQVEAWQVNDKWKPKKFISRQLPGTQGYYELEMLFNQDFDVSDNAVENYDVAPSSSKNTSNTFWANEELMPYLWGFYNFGQYKGSTAGADGRMADVFETLKTPSAGIKNDKKSQQKNTIAIIDTGINYNHQDINPNIWVNSKDQWDDGKDNDKNGYIDDTFGYDFVNNRPLGWDNDGHGTHVAGTAGGAANNLGILGTNPAANIMNVKVLGSDGGTTAGFIRGINYAVKNGAKVLNASLGGDYYSKSEYNALKNAQKKKCLIIAASGNDSRNIDETPNYPAAYNLKSIISVASSNWNDGWSDFSNWGRKNVDLYAPGETIVSSWPNSDSSYNDISGTSMATPYVSGVVSAFWARNKKMKPNKVKKRLLNTVDPSIWLDEYEADTVSGGRINAARFFGINSFRNESTGKSNYSLPPRQEIPINPNKPELSAFEVNRKNIDNLTGGDMTPLVIGMFKGNSKKRFKRNFENLLNDMDGLKYGSKIDLEHFESLGGNQFTVDMSGIKPFKRIALASILLKNDFVEFLELDTPKYIA